MCKQTVLMPLTTLTCQTERCFESFSCYESSTNGVSGAFPAMSRLSSKTLLTSSEGSYDMLASKLGDLRGLRVTGMLTFDGR